MKVLIIGMALMVIAVVPGIPAWAQGSKDVDARPQVGCFRGRPLPACKSFWIVEMQGSSPVAQTSRSVIRVYSDPTRSGLPQASEYQLRTFDNVLEWNLGHMANLGDKYALGGVVTVGSGNDDALSGLKVRVRRWLNSDLSVEAEAGALWTNAGSVRRSNGGTAALRFNIRDQGSIFLRWDMLPLREESRSGEYGYSDPGGTQHGLSVGLSAGSVPALIGTGALGVTMLVLLAIIVGQGGLD